MTTTHQSRSVRRALQSTSRTLGYDGPVAHTAVLVFRHFFASVMFIMCMLPAITFTALIGWQATHLAVWVGAGAVLPIWPGSIALLAAMRRVVSRHDERKHWRKFWRDYRTAARRFGWWAVCASLIVVVLQYDLALGSGPTTAVAVLIGVAVLVVITVGIGSTFAVGGAPASARETLVIISKALILRPHVALAWVLIVGLGCAALAIPVVGPSLALFAPAAATSTIAIVNNALGFDRSLTAGEGSD